MVVIPLEMCDWIMTSGCQDTGQTLKICMKKRLKLQLPYKSVWREYKIQLCPRNGGNLIYIYWEHTNWWSLNFISNSKIGKARTFQNN